jgi:hypothetical protein
VKLRILCQSAALVVLSILCLAGALFLLMHPIDIAPLPAGTGLPLAVLDKRPSLNIAGPDRASLTTIALRPLFVRSRRPYERARPLPPRAVAPEVASFNTPPVPIDLLLKGVAFQPNMARAMIVSSAHPDGIWLEKNADIDGWKINRISRDSVILMRGAQAMELSLYPKAPAGFGLKHPR